MVDRWEAEVDEALHALREDVSEMSATAFTAGRARLLSTIGAPPVAAGIPAANDAVVVALAPDRRRRSPPLRRAAPWVGVAAAVAVVAVGAVVLLPGDSGSGPAGGTPAGASPEPTTSSATANEPQTTGRPTPPTGRPGEPLPPMPAKALNKAGELAEGASVIEVSPGQVLYVRSARTQASGDGGSGGTDVEELWIPADREARWLQRRTASGNIQGRSDKDFEEKRAAGGRFDGHEPQSRWAVTPEKMAALPRDPAALYELLRAEVNADLGPGVGTSMTSAQNAASILISLLADRTNGVPADLRAAALRTLAYLPDITVKSDARTTDNRPAIALGWIVDEGLYRNELLLDPATARTVEWRNVAIKAFQGYQPDQAFTSDLITEAIVAELGQRP